MNIQNKRYYVVFTGLFLILVGLFIYFLNPSKKVKKESVGLTKSKLVSSKSVKKVKAEKAKGLPVNFVYEVPNFKKTIPHNVGMKRHIEDMDKMQIVCNGKNCKRQVLTGANAKTYKCAKTKKQNVIKGDVLFSKNSLKHLKSNTKIVGDLYIKNINFLKIPANFTVIGNIYVINSEGVTFTGKSFIDGHIFVKGKSSVRALPYNVKLNGQIFI